MVVEKLDKLEAALAADSASLEVLKQKVKENESVELEARRQALIFTQKKYTELQRKANAREEVLKRCEEDSLALRKICENTVQEAGSKLEILQDLINVEETAIQEAAARRDQLLTQVPDPAIHQDLAVTEKEIAQIALDLRSIILTCEQEEAKLFLMQQRKKRKSSFAQKEMQTITNKTNKSCTDKDIEPIVKTSSAEQQQNEYFMTKNKIETTFEHMQAASDLSEVCELARSYQNHTHESQRLQARAEKLRQQIDKINSDNETIKSNCRNSPTISDYTLEQVKLAVAHFRGLVRRKHFATPTDNQLTEYVTDLNLGIVCLMTKIINFSSFPSHKRRC